MFKKTIKYTDFDGNEREETFYFNLTEAEVTKMELGASGGYSNMLRRIIASQDSAEIMKTFEQFIIDSYGEKSADGREFVKSPEITQKFMSTEAYSKLFIELCTDTNAAAEFANGVLPKAPPVVKPSE